jgi:hypothetical protein
MTGAVSWEVLIWIVGLMLAAGGIVAGFLFWVWRIVAGFNTALDERDTAAQLEKERAKMVEEELRRDLNDYKVQVADKYATKDGVSSAVGRVESSVERIGSMVHDSVERLTNRLDRILEHRSENPTPPRRSG